MFENRVFSTHSVYKYQHWPGLGKDTIRKPILDYPIDVKLFLLKELNKPNILQKLDFIPAHELDQKLSPSLTTEEPTIKVTPANK